MPLEDTIDKMRRDLRVSRVEAHVPGGATEPALDISFAYPDKAKARAVVARLVSEAVDRSATINAERALFWQELWPHDPPPASLHQVQILSPASVPGKPSAPNRLAFMAVGMGAGLLLGLLV